MKRAILLGATLSAALATSLGAQPPKTSGAESPAQAAGNQVTMTGCLKPGDSGSAAGFILTDAKSGSAAAATGTAGASTTGASTTGAGASSTTAYKLQGGNPSDLRKLVNNKVEVRGTLSKDSTAAPATAGPTGAAGATGSGASATRESGTSANVPTLQVTSVRQVASSCTP